MLPESEGARETEVETVGKASNKRHQSRDSLHKATIQYRCFCGTRPVTRHGSRRDCRCLFAAHPRLQPPSPPFCCSVTHAHHKNLLNHAHHRLRCVVMARVYVKQRGDQSSLPHPPRMEVKLERLEGLPVEEFVENVARQLNLDKQQLRG